MEDSLIPRPKLRSSVRGAGSVTRSHARAAPFRFSPATPPPYGGDLLKLRTTSQEAVRVHCHLPRRHRDPHPRARGSTMRTTVRLLTGSALAVAAAGLVCAPAHAGDAGGLEILPSSVVPGGQVTVTTAACG